jgi:hypothetical protein
MLSNKTPSVLKRLRKQVAAWTTLAKDTEFAGMKIGDFEGHVLDLESTVESLDKNKALVRAGIKARHEAEKKAMLMSKRFAKAVASHPEFGEDSQLLRASGFKTESEIKRGRRSNASKATDNSEQR